MGQNGSHDDGGSEYKGSAVTSYHDTVHRGLYNATSLHHCFLNVVIQSLWHIAPFRTQILRTQHNHNLSTAATHIPCVTCALQTVFVQYEYSHHEVIPPDALRITMSQVDSQRFGLNRMADATECFESLLQRLHIENVSQKVQFASADTPCQPDCISHVVFGANMCDVRVCRVCAAASEPIPSLSFTYTAIAADLIRFAPHDGTAPDMSRLLKLSYCNDRYKCALRKECDGIAEIDRWVLSLPLVLAVTLVWPAHITRPQLTHIYSIIKSPIHIDTAFRYCASNEEKDKRSMIYQLSGLICFYGAHYIVCFYSPLLQQWLMFDDKRVIKLGGWRELTDRLLSGMLTPIIAFYHTTDDYLLEQVMMQSFTHITQPATAAPHTATSVAASAPPALQQQQNAQSSAARFVSPIAVPPVMTYAARNAGETHLEKAIASTTSRPYNIPIQHVDPVVSDSLVAQALQDEERAIELRRRRSEQLQQTRLLSSPTHGGLVAVPPVHASSVPTLPSDNHQQAHHPMFTYNPH